MINLDNIFHLFGPDDNFDGVDNGTTYMDFKNTPTYWVGMYKKLILNHLNFNTKVLNFFKQSNKEFNIDDIREAGEYVVFNRAWSYISNVDIKNKGYIDALKHYSDDEFYSTLDMGIEFFQQDELYERCAFLLKIKKKSLKLKK